MNPKQFLIAQRLYPEKIAYVESNNWGVRVENKMNQNIEFCWINKLCIPIDYDLRLFKWI